MWFLDKNWKKKHRRYPLKAQRRTWHVCRWYNMLDDIERNLHRADNIRSKKQTLPRMELRERNKEYYPHGLHPHWTCHGRGGIFLSAKMWRMYRIWRTGRGNNVIAQRDDSAAVNRLHRKPTKRDGKSYKHSKLTKVRIRRQQASETEKWRHPTDSNWRKRAAMEGRSRKGGTIKKMNLSKRTKWKSKSRFEKNYRLIRSFSQLPCDGKAVACSGKVEYHNKARTVKFISILQVELRLIGYAQRRRVALSVHL